MTLPVAKQDDSLKQTHFFSPQVISGLPCRLRRKHNNSEMAELEVVRVTFLSPQQSIDVVDLHIARDGTTFNTYSLYICVYG